MKEIWSTFWNQFKCTSLNAGFLGGIHLVGKSFLFKYSMVVDMFVYIAYNF